MGFCVLYSSGAGWVPMVIQRKCVHQKLHNIAWIMPHPSFQSRLGPLPINQGAPFLAFFSFMQAFIGVSWDQLQLYSLSMLLISYLPLMFGCHPWRCYPSKKAVKLTSRRFPGSTLTVCSSCILNHPSDTWPTTAPQRKCTSGVCWKSE
jgi:hypothetical protein